MTNPVTVWSVSTIEPLDRQWIDNNSAATFGAASNSLPAVTLPNEVIEPYRFDPIRQIEYLHWTSRVRQKCVVKPSRQLVRKMSRYTTVFTWAAGLNN